MFSSENEYSNEPNNYFPFVNELAHYSLNPTAGHSFLGHELSFMRFNYLIEGDGRIGNPSHFPLNQKTKTCSIT